MAEPNDDPVVLYDVKTEQPITDSQLREIVDAVAAEMVAGSQTIDPRSLPLYWKNEASGVLQPAIVAYIEHGGYPNQYPAPTADQIGLIKRYLELYMIAPCWKEGDQGQLAALRKSVRQIQDLASLDQWLDEAMQWGFDPL